MIDKRVKTVLEFKKNIVLTGFMGSGKTSVGRFFEENYHIRCVEMDREIENLEGRTISDIFKDEGENYFREVETRTLKEVLAKDNQVISCGGGTVLRRENVELMKNNGVVIWLKASPKVILQRVMEDENRPLLKGKKNITDIEKIMNERKEKYEEAADVEIDTDGRSVEEVCRLIIENLLGAGENYV